LKLAAGKTPRNPACGFVDNSLAKTRQRTGALAVDKSQKTATYPPRSPLTTNSTGASRFDSKCKGQNQKFRLIPLLELTYAIVLFTGYSKIFQFFQHETAG